MIPDVRLPAWCFVLAWYRDTQEVYVPDGVGCGTPGDAYWQMNMLREVLLSRAEDLDSTPYEELPAAENKRGTILFLNREKGGERNGRAENQDYFRKTKAQIEKAFPERTVEVFTDANKTLLGCVECTARMFNRAVVVIAKHGGKGAPVEPV